MRGRVQARECRRHWANTAGCCLSRAATTLQVLDASAPVPARLRRGHDPGALSDGRAGDHRAGVARLRDVALLGVCYRHEGDLRDGRESSASINVDPALPRIAPRKTRFLPAGGMNIRWPTAMEQELRLQHDKIYARSPIAEPTASTGSPSTRQSPRLGIVASGTALPGRAAGVAERQRTSCRRNGIRLLKWACPAPTRPMACASSLRGSTRSSRSRKAPVDRVPDEGAALQLA